MSEIQWKKPKRQRLYKLYIEGRWDGFAQGLTEGLSLSHRSASLVRRTVLPVMREMESQQPQASRERRLLDGSGSETQEGSDRLSPSPVPTLRQQRGCQPPGSTGRGSPWEKPRSF